MFTKVSGSVLYKSRNNKRKFEYGANKENNCSNVVQESFFDSKLTTQKAKKRVTEEAKFKPKKEHIVDSILAAQRTLFGCNDVSLERKKQRKVAELMTRTIFIGDNLNSFKELERLCGRSLQDGKANPLKKFVGLVLKDEFLGVTDLNEEKFLNREWEEGEIIILD